MPSNTESFFDDQTDQTAYKIFFFKSYVCEWMIKLLMYYGQCFVADLFCGTGMNGVQKGSPLILVESCNELLNSPILKKKFPKPEIIVLLNDFEKDNIDMLNKNLKDKVNPNIVLVPPQIKDYKEIITKTKELFKNHPSYPKFFFLDPFTYSTVDMESIKTIMSFKNAEILLFLPTFHAFRFSKSDKLNCPKLNNFIENFLTGDQFDDIFGFVESIKIKIETETDSYVRPIIIDGGKSKNSLFLITKSLIGLDAMNNLVWKTSGEKWGVNISKHKAELQNKDQLKLFITADVETKNDQELKGLLTTYISARARTNGDIIRFVIKNMFRLTHARRILQKLHKEGFVEIDYMSTDLKKGSLYITISDLDNLKTKFTIKRK